MFLLRKRKEETTSAADADAAADAAPRQQLPPTSTPTSRGRYSTFFSRWCSKNVLRAAAYGSTNFAASALHSIFITYYLDLFLNVYHIDSSWFYWGEVVYMLWNSCNDPLFGWLMQRTHATDLNTTATTTTTSSSSSSSSATHRRVLRHLSAIQYGGAAWAFAFLIPFFPLWRLNSHTKIGLHFILSLCLYDALLSYVMLAHAALLADVSLRARERLRCNQWNSTLGAIGSSSLFLAHFYWHRVHLIPFKWLCLGLSVIAYIGFQITAELVTFDDKKNEEEMEEAVEEAAAAAAAAASSSSSTANAIELLDTSSPLSSADINESKSIKKTLMRINYSTDDGAAYRRRSSPPLRLFLAQLRQHPNFWIFIAINFIQVFNCHYNSNFLSIWLAFFLAALPRWLPSAVVGASSVAPHLIVLLLTSLIDRIGLPAVLRRLFWIKVGVAVAAVAVGVLTVAVVGVGGDELPPVASSSALVEHTFLSHIQSSIYFAITNGWLLVALYLFINKSFNEAICRLGNLLMTDLIDEDVVRNQRHTSVSTMMHGVNAFLTKPGQSLAPMFGFALLSHSRYAAHAALQSRMLEIDPHTSHPAVLASDPMIRIYLFLLITCVPMACGLAQLLLFHRYTLHGATLARIRAKRGR